MSFFCTCPPGLLAEDLPAQVFPGNFPRRADSAPGRQLCSVNGPREATPTRLMTLSFSHWNQAGMRGRHSSPGIRGDLSSQSIGLGVGALARQHRGEFPLVSGRFARGYRLLAEDPPPRDFPGRFPRRAIATRGKIPLPRGSGGSARQLPGQIPGRSALSEEPVPLRQSDRYERELCRLLCRTWAAGA